MWNAVIAGAVSGGAIMMTAGVAEAAIVIDITETAAGVVASGRGSFDTSGMFRRRIADSFGTGLNGGLGVIRFGAGSFGTGYETVTINGPASFGGNGFYRNATTSTGVTFGLFGAENSLILPVDYVSGSALLGEMVFAGATLRTLALTAGTYIYRGGNDETVTINIGTINVVPEPASWAMMTLGLAAIGYTIRRRRTTIHAHA
jgi:hypothetical protein